MSGRALIFPVRMAWRETRAAWREFLAFVLCVMLGVAALASVGTLGAALDRALAREARALLGGDVEVRAARPHGAGVAGELDRLAREGGTVAHVRELVGMARDERTGRSLLVELKAPAPAWPLYGALDTSPALPLDRLLAHGGAVVGADLLARLGLAVGDRFTLGRMDLTIRGVVTREPDTPASLVRLGPRVLLSPEDLDRTDLVQRGSRVRHRALVRLPDGAAATARARLVAASEDAGVRVVSFDESQPGLHRFLDQATAYLGLVSLASLVVGGTGVASAVTMFLRRRVAALAVLKTIGADSRTLVLTYLLQTQALGLSGSAAGVLLGVAAAPLLARVLREVLPLAIDLRPDPWPLARAAAIGTLAALLCALWPLLRIRAVRTSVILRSPVDPALPGARRPWLVALPIVTGLAALAVWQAGSFRLGVLFALGCGVALALLAGVARAVAIAGRASGLVRGFAWRHGVAGLARPGGHARVVVVALGVGVMLLTAVALLERSLLREMDHEQRRAAPSFFFVDVQPDQVPAFASVVASAGGVPPALTAVVRSRLAAIDGVPVTRDLVTRRAREGQAWYFTRDYVLTSADGPPAGNAVVRGRWWTPAEGAARPRVSIEEDAATALGVRLGSRLTFDVQGVPIDAEVMNVRKVDWQSLSTNFFMILSPGALDGAPTSYVGTVRVAAHAEPGVQDAVVRAFPNVTAVGVRDVLDRLRDMLDRLALAIHTIAIFTIATGLVVMVGALAASRYQRLYESVVLRTIGASRATVARVFAVEYACLGLAAGVGGAALASALAWAVLRFVLAVPWALDPGVLAGGIGAATGLAMLVGFVATYRLLGVKPLVVLRRE